jgi:hypothetical protein
MKSTILSKRQRRHRPKVKNSNFEIEKFQKKRNSKAKTMTISKEKNVDNAPGTPANDEVTTPFEEEDD